MSDTVTIRNKRAIDIEIPDVGVVEAGGTIDVPAELANGTPGSGDHPGISGLLDQTDAWEKVGGKRSTSTPSGEEA